MEFNDILAILKAKGHKILPHSAIVDESTGQMTVNVDGYQINRHEAEAVAQNRSTLKEILDVQKAKRLWRVA